MFKKLGILLLVLAILCNFTVITNTVVHAAGVTYYVSDSTGDDSRTAVQAQNVSTPWKTISKAAQNAQAGDTVIIKAGTYRETVTPTNSGTSGNPITYKAAAGETVTISGANVVTGTWVQDNGSIYRTSVTLPYTKGNNQVFVDSAMVYEARWPNHTDSSILNPAWATIDSGSTSTSIYDADMPNIDWTGALVWISSNLRWGDWTSEVTGYSNRTVSFTNDTEEPWVGYNFCNVAAGGKYVLIGIYGAMDVSNEWYYNGSGTLYIYGNPAGKNIEYKARDNAFDLSGKQYINIEGVNIFASAVKFGNASYCKLNGITAKYVSHAFAPYAETGNQAIYGYNYGITMNGGHDNEIKNSTLQYASHTILSMIGGYNNRVVNNLIQYGNYYGGFWASNMWYSDRDLLVSHNTISDSGRQCLFPAGYHSVIQYNNFYNGMFLTNDGGVVYTSNNDGANTEWHHNWIHDSSYASFYPDDRTSYHIVYNNVIWGGQNYAVINNGPTGYIVFDNNQIQGAFKSDGSYTEPFISDNYKTRVTNNVITGNVLTASNCYVADNASSGFNQYAYGTPGHDFSNPPNPTLTFNGHLYMNHLKNGSFEQGLADWTSSGSVAYSLESQAYTYNGASIAKFTGTGGRLEQTITGLSPNTTYEFGAAIKSYDGGTVTIGVKDYGGSEMTTSSTSSTWSRRSIDFTTGAANTSVTVYVTKSSGTGNAHVDHMGLVYKYAGSPADSASSMSTVVNDTFNSDATGADPAGWTVSGDPTGGSISVQEVPSAADKSVRQYQQNNAAAVVATRSFTARSGEGITVEWKARAEQTNKWVSMYVLGSNSSAACPIAFNTNGKFTYSDGGTWRDGPTYATGTFYDIKVVANTDTDKYDLYVNGSLVQSNIGMHFAQTDIGKLSFQGSTGSYPATAYFNDVKVSVPSVRVVNETFNNNTTGADPTGWTLTGDPTGGDVSVQDVPSSSDKGMKLYQQNGNAAVSATRSFTARSGEGITVEWKARAEQTNKWVSMYVLGSSGAAACPIAFNTNGKFMYSDGGTWRDGPTYATGTFYDIKVVANTDTDKYDLYINGSLVQNNINMHTAQTDIGKVSFQGTTGGYPATAYFNDVKVSVPATWTVNDAFNSETTGADPTGWTVAGDPTGGSISVQEVPSATDKSVRLYQQNNAAAVAATRSFTARSGEGITVEWKARAEQTNKWVSMYVLGSSGAAACPIAFNTNGKFTYSDGGTWRDGPTYATGTFYDIKVVANTDTDKYDLYVNGSLVQSNIGMHFTQTDIGKLSFEGATNGYPATAYFNDVKVKAP